LTDRNIPPFYGTEVLGQRAKRTLHFGQGNHDKKLRGWGDFFLVLKQGKKGESGKGKKSGQQGKSKEG